ncbi:MAG: trypsin-like peptidase domain-containing protein [Planctomycetota bacterium]
MKPRTAETKPVRQAPPWSDAIQNVVSQRYPRGIADLKEIQNQVQTVVRYARPAVVGVQIGNSVGSGVIVNAEGLVLTAGHVAMQPNRPVRFMFPDGSRARGVTLGVNQSIDSGMMKITDKGPWPFVDVAPSDALADGEWVVGLGQPNGYFRDRAPPVRIGRVLYKDADVINTDCTLVGGDSGGPLFNLKGQVVGIHSRIGRRITSNFHVPISTYELTWDRLLAGEIWGGSIASAERARNRPFLGVTCNPREEGCRVTQVMPGMPAERAGIKVGDVITRYGETEIASFAELAAQVLKTRPGSRVKLKVEREGKAIELQVRMAQVGRDFPGAPPLES